MKQSNTLQITTTIDPRWLDSKAFDGSPDDATCHWLELYDATDFSLPPATILHSNEGLAVPNTFNIDIGSEYTVGALYLLRLKYKVNTRSRISGDVQFELQPRGETPQMITLKLKTGHGPCRGRTGFCHSW
ncbi:hypothetical protein [Pseudomonas sp. GZD-222]|uniref:hypothetical protein n=1 Tax=Pseudomonas sp. GZD-222 TaxID=3404805 RepID=UPI003BB59445